MLPGMIPVIAGGASDPNFASVVLLNHFNAADGSTTFVDSSTKNRSTSAVNGNARIRTAQSKFGGSAGYCDGTGDDIRWAGSADFALGNTYTIECWLYFDSVANTPHIVHIGNSLSDRFILWIQSNVLRVQYVNTLYMTSGTLSTGQWYHIAVAKDGTNLRLFVNGTQAGSTNSSNTFPGGTPSACVGTMHLGSPAGGDYFNGYIDDLRITKGACRYTANFTPPAAQFPH